MPDALPERYEERWSVPWWCWLGALAIAAFLAAELHLGAPGWRAWIPYAVLLPLTVLGLGWFGRGIRLAVEDGELRVDDAHIDVRHVTGVRPLDADARRHLLGPGADRMAFVVQRPWVRGTVQVTIDDPADPTPYWVLSARRPDRLAAALRTTRTTSASGAAAATGEPAGRRTPE